MMRRRGSFLSVMAVTVTFVATFGCSSDSTTTTSTTTHTTRTHAVGVVSETVVNTSTPLTTKADSSEVQRSLPTTIYYPAVGTIGAEPLPDASADTGAGPYPLIVFSHGLGASPDAYRDLLIAWAAAGYVVAAPAFPHTSTAATGGVDPGDFTNQPGDVSAVIDATLQESERGDGQLSGMVEPDDIGVAGHSLGGITTLGVAANTCCRDDRVKAAVVLSGDPLTFPDGHFDYTTAPPILLVHGTDDDLVTYEASVGVFNEAKAPKGLLTIEHGDHGAPMSPSGPAFATVVASTVDFFDAYLKGDVDALDRLRRDGGSDTTRVVVASDRGTEVTLPTAPAQPARALDAQVSPSDDLAGGQTVTVSWTGFTPGNTINIVQCSNRTAGDASACDLETGKILQPNPTGSGSLPFEIVTGPVGTGICDSTTADCQIVVNDGGSLDPDASVRVSISFAPS